MSFNINTKLVSTFLSFYIRLGIIKIGTDRTDWAKQYIAFYQLLIMEKCKLVLDCVKNINYSFRTFGVSR